MAEANGVPDVTRLAMSPRTVIKKKVPTDKKKSTKQTMEDLAVFVSPREIQKKFVVAPKNRIELSLSEITDPDLSASIPVIEDQTASSRLLTTTPPEVIHSAPAVEQVPKIGSIRDRMKIFERNDDSGNQAPWMSSQYRGKRGTALDTFTPKRDAKDIVHSKRKQDNEDLPLVSLYQQADETNNINVEPENTILAHEEELKIEEPAASPADDEDKETMSRSESESESTPVSPKNNKLIAKIDRDTLVLTEIRKMIKDTEDNEIEDDMDDQVKECLEQAALQSPAYNRRWYDALTDSWIHCPSLATIIMDFTLIEAAEVLYGDELPMVYTVSLRSVAAEVMSGEDELPEYVYRLAS